MRVGQVKNEGKTVLSRRNNGSKIMEAQNRKVVVEDYNKVENARQGVLDEAREVTMYYHEELIAIDLANDVLSCVRLWK